MRCSTEKIGYESKLAAESAANRFERINGDRGLGAYHCLACGQWHVGHQPGSGHREDRSPGKPFRGNMRKVRR